MWDGINHAGGLSLKYLFSCHSTNVAYPMRLYHTQIKKTKHNVLYSVPVIHTQRIQ